MAPTVTVTVCLLFTILFKKVNSQSDGSGCVWDNLDLTELRDIETPIRCPTPNNYFLEYRPCMNSLECKTEDPLKYMMTQDNNQPVCVHNLASWDNGTVQPEYNSIDGGIWTFQYQNGATSGCGGVSRIAQIIFLCSTYDGLYDETNITCSEPAPCVYSLTIPTKYACVSTVIPTSSPTNAPTTSPSYSPSSSPTSAPTVAATFEMNGFGISVIAVISILALYCFIGCLFNTFSGSDKIIPHYAFWNKLFLYVVTGFSVVFCCWLCADKQKQRDTKPLLVVNAPDINDKTKNDNVL